MNSVFQSILDKIPTIDHLSVEEKEAFIKALRDSEKNQRMLQFKLERVEKDRHTLQVMLEESIEDLQKKSRAIEAQNRELEIESALERVRSVAMGMKIPEDMLEVCKMIALQLESLKVKEIRNVQTAIFVEAKSMYFNYEFYSKHNKTLITEVNYSDHPVAKNFAEQMLKGPNQVWMYAFRGQEVKDWLNYQKNTNVFVDSYLENADTLDYYWNSLGPVAIGMSAYTPLREEQIELFKRFRNVFELAYRRYLDIKKAEAQAREANIEAALEKVRSRSLAMHKSDELQDVVHAVFEKLNELSFELDTAIIIVFAEGSKDTVWWLQNSANQQYLRIAVDYADIFYLRNLFEARENKGDLPSGLYSFEQKNELLNYLFDHTDFRFTPPEQKESLLQKECATMSAAIAQNTAIHVTRYFKKSFSEKESEILKKFSNVFDQAYTRFLDLQRAEAQARESQIQLALERVRARTMAMHHSDELTDVAALLFKQVSDLGIKTWTTGFNVWSEDNNFYTDYITNPEGGFVEPYTIDANQFSVFKLMSDAKKRGDEFFVHYEEGELLAETYRQLARFGKDQFKGILESGFQFPTKQFEHVVFGSKVSLMFITYEPVPEAHDIFKRFGKVFEQTYTRFLDLQKAEANARESQIEAALERVRAKAMAMHNVDDLNPAVAIVFEELDKLNLGMLRCGIGIIDGEKRTVAVWTTSVSDASNTVQVSGAESLDIHPLLQGAFEAWITQSDFSYRLEGDDLLQYYKAVGETNIRLPRSQAEAMTQFYYVTSFGAGGLFAFQEAEFSDEGKAVMKRFANVFNLTYKRFLDLQKAEAQAREGQIQLALERARAQSMIMQHSTELDDTLRVFHEQVLQLNVPSAFSFLWLPDEEKGRHIFWAAWAENGSFKSKAINYPLDKNEPATAQCLVDWKSNESVVAYHVPPAGVENYFAAWNELIAGVEQLRPEYFSDGLFYVEAFMKYGCFGVMVKHPLHEDEKKILERFATEFERAYTRFLDLQKAEAQAREAQIEAALERVRSKTLAMQKSDELAATASVLFQQLINLGIEPNRLYINIVKNENGEGEFWITDEDGSKVAMAYSTNLNTNPTFKKMYDGWRAQKKSLIIDIHGKELDEYFKFLNELNVPFKDGLSPKRRLQYIAYFGKGFIGMASPDEQPAETMQLLERFAAVFNLTFTRFNDLKIAEAHALKAEQDLIEIKAARKHAEDALVELQATQKQLVQSEKMASLGELTAGIAHEIQNPLNFVNNFSDVSNELLEEMKAELEKGNTKDAAAIVNDVKQNLEKILYHGKRADAIVKGMLQHSRTSSGQKELTDINALADEYLRLAYHGLRAKDKSFNAKFITDFDDRIGKISIIPQEMGRVILNLINNAFYTVNEKQKRLNGSFEPTVSVSTKKVDDTVIITVADNGNGIPQKNLDKIFQPFFTTKPTGQGTGLGLSLAYDIVTKGHNGEIKIETKEGEGSKFIVIIPST